MNEFDVYGAIFDDVLNMANEATDMLILKGPLPNSESIAMDIATGAPQSIMLSRSTLESVNIVINGKSDDMAKLRGEMGKIHAALTSAAAYPNKEQYQMTSIETTQAPSYADRESGGQWLYVSAIEVKFYHRKEIKQ